MNRARQEGPTRKPSAGQMQSNGGTIPAFLPVSIGPIANGGISIVTVASVDGHACCAGMCSRIDLVRVIASVPQWFPLGDSDKPRASRRGKYFPEWIRANGGPPARRDRLSPGVFVYRWPALKLATQKAPRHIPLSAESSNGRQGFWVTQSASHTVKEGPSSVR